MSTEYNYVVNLDTSRVMGQLSGLRSQVGMAIGGSPTGFAGYAAPPTGFGNLADVSGGISAGFQQMAHGFGGVQSGFGGTFTNPAIALNPHYGAIQAETHVNEERRIMRFGARGATEFTPPGVNPTEYALAVQGNAIAREEEVAQAAWQHGRDAFVSTVGATAASSLALGGAKGIAKGLSAVGVGRSAAGRLIGGAAPIAASFIAYDVVERVVTERAADAQKAAGIAKEMGQIVGAGRNLDAVQMNALGWGTLDASRDIGMDAQVMGDIMALARQHGMLPKSTDQEGIRKEAAAFASSVNEAAQVLHTSLSGAVQVIKGAVQQGKSARDGILDAAGMGGAEEYLRFQAFGRAGARVARSQELSGAQGFGLFTAALGQASGAGLSGEEMKILGGRYGVAQMTAMTTMAASKSPLGSLQLMAGLTGEPLGDMTQLPGQAIAALSGGGDLIGGMLSFRAHEDQLRRGVGARGLQTQARHMIDMMADQMMDVSPKLSQFDARVNTVMNMFGYSATQARGYVQSLWSRGGGGGRANKLGRQIMAYNDLLATPPNAALSSPGFVDQAMATLEDNAGELIGGGIGSVIGGAMGSAIPIPVVGTMIGATAGAWVGSKVGGFIQSTGETIADAWDYEGGMLSYLTDPEDVARFESAQMARRIRDRRATLRREAGVLDLDPRYARKVSTARVEEYELDLDALNTPAASKRLAATLAMRGVSPLAKGGRGTIRADGRYWDASIVQDVATGKGGKLTKREIADQKAAAIDLILDIKSNKESAADMKEVGLLLAKATASPKGGLTKDEGDFLRRFGFNQLANDSTPDEIDREALIREAQIKFEGVLERSSDSASKTMIEKIFRGGDFSSKTLQYIVSKASGYSLGPEYGQLVAGGSVAATLKQAHQRDVSVMEQKIAARAFGVGYASPEMVSIIHSARQDKRWADDPSSVIEEKLANSAAGKLLEGKDGAQLRKSVKEFSRDEVVYVRRSAEEIEANRGAVEKWSQSDFAQGIGKAANVLSAGMIGEGQAAQGVADLLYNTTTKKVKDVEDDVDKRSGKGGKGGGRRGGVDHLERTIGFGQQESAMSTINRALKRTAKSVDILADKVSKLEPKPAKEPE